MERIWGKLESHENDSLFLKQITQHSYVIAQITKDRQEEKDQCCPVITTGHIGTTQDFSTPCLLHVLPILVCPEDNCKE